MFQGRRPWVRRIFGSIVICASCVVGACNILCGWVLSWWEGSYCSVKKQTHIYTSIYIFYKKTLFVHPFFLRLRDFPFFTGRGIRDTGYGNLHFTRHHGIIPNPVQSRGISPAGKVPGKALLISGYFKHSPPKNWFWAKRKVQTDGHSHGLGIRKKKLRKKYKIRTIWASFRKKNSQKVVYLYDEHASSTRRSGGFLHVSAFQFLLQTNLELQTEKID